jgi:hypothetical protein
VKVSEAMSYFPDSFAWILEYLATYIGACPLDIFNGLVVLEKEIENLTRAKTMIVGDFHRARTKAKFMAHIYQNAWSCMT